MTRTLQFRTRWTLRGSALALALMTAACTGPAPGDQAPGSSATPGAEAAPWLNQASPFPDPRAKDQPAPAAGSAEAAGTEQPDAGPPRGDSEMPPLPPGMEVHRLPRATADNPEVDRRPPTGSGPVARVNGEEIPREVYNIRCQRTLDTFFGMARSMPRSVWKQVVGSTLQQLVHRTIDKQKAKEFNIVASQEALDKEYQKFIDERGGAAMFPRFLKHMHVSEQDIKEDIAAKVLHDALLVRGLGDLTIPDEQVATWYAEHRMDYARPAERQLRQIFFHLAETTDPALKLATLQQAQQALRLVRSGKDFVEVAKTSSEGASRSKGGDMGWLHRGQMPAEFDAVAFSQKVGTVSEVVQSPLGFHLIQVVAERPPHVRPLDDELKLQIRRTLQTRQYQERLADLTRRWYGEAKVEYLDPVIQAEALAVEQQGKKYRVP